jgi:Protein of unknown function (DUF3631)
MTQLSASELLQLHGVAYVKTKSGKFTTACPNCGKGYCNVKEDKEGVQLYCRDCEKGGWAFFDGRSGGDLFGGRDDSKRNGAMPPIKAVYQYTDKDGGPAFQVVRFDTDDPERRFRQRRDEHTWSLKGCKIVPFKLHELVREIADGKRIYIVEGEKDALTLRKHGFAATCNPMGAGKWREEWGEIFAGADVVITGDHDEPGRRHVQDVARKLKNHARRIHALDLATIWPEIEESQDVSDWFEAGGTVEQLDAAIAALAPWQEGNGHDAAPPWDEERRGNDDEQADEDKIAALAELSSIAYQRRRVQAAQDLGIGVGVLDKLVRQRLVKIEEVSAELPHWTVEPWDEPVDGAALLDAIEAIFRRYIVLPEGAAHALALWVLHAWTFDAGDISPFLVLVSPTKRCGKTNTLIILLFLTPRSELASNISPSAMFRSIEDDRPTLLIDEADSFLKDNEEMRGILNGGHTKAAAYVKRNVEVNGEHKPRRFSTWAPKAIATIRALADTLEDRSIIIQLQRKPKSTKLPRLRHRDSEELAALRRKAARWAADNFSKLTNPDPEVPDALNDRAADNWRPLLAIADLVGGMWPEQARKAACVLSGDAEETSSDVRILAHIRQVFGDQEAMRSVDLVARLVADLEWPWAEYGRAGKPLSQKQLAGLLKPFEIVSTNVRLAGLQQGKGYRRADFEGAWAAYCPGQIAPDDAFQAFHPSHRPNGQEMPVESAQLDDSRSVPEAPLGRIEESQLDLEPCGFPGPWDAGTDEKAETRAARGFDHESGPPRCAYCGQEGALVQAALPGRPGIFDLHQECHPRWYARETGRGDAVRRYHRSSTKISGT